MEHKLRGGVRVDPEANVDDVLVQRIVRLRNELDKERKAHRSDVEELKERLEVALEINAKLRAERVTEEPRRRSQQIADEHIDILATIMSMYPYMPTDDIVIEFGVIEPRIRYVAEVFGVMKSKEARDEAREYLRKQDIELIERRGGDQGNYNPICKQVEKVSVDGRVMETYRSVKAAAAANKITGKTVRKYCHANLYTKKGYTFRYQKLEDNGK